MDTTEGYDPDVWKQMGDQMGLQGLIVPEEYGGSGYTYVELTVVLEEMGRALLCAPFFSTVVLAANTLIHAVLRGRQGQVPPRHRLGRGHRHRRLHRGERPLGRGGRDPHRRRRRHAQRHEDVRDRRPHRRLHRRAGPQGRRRPRALRRARRRLRPHPHAPVHDGPDPQAGPPRVQRRAGRGDLQERLRLVGLLHRPRPRQRRPGGRAGRRGPEGARHVGRVRQGPGAVRAPHRLVPGHQAQVRRHAARGRVGQVGRLLRGLVRSRAERRAAVGGLAWPRPTAPRRTSTRPPRTSRSTAASASRGSTRPTSTSSGPSPPSCCSATPPTTGSCWRSASASDPSSPRPAVRSSGWWAGRRRSGWNAGVSPGRGRWRRRAP